MLDGRKSCFYTAIRGFLDGNWGRFVQVCINGNSEDVRDGLTVAELLQQLEMNPLRLAVERNCELVPRTEHAACRLEPGDRLEIVTLVGGG
jgi:thiamine biosynthesis protein ThiS